jgi:hypothetical protein
MTNSKKGLFWIFNGLMLCGAVLGVFIYHTSARLLETASHDGPGIVNYGEDADHSKVVSESQYKRHHFTMDGMMLLFVLGAWVWVAKYAKDKHDGDRNGAGT